VAGADRGGFEIGTEVFADVNPDSGLYTWDEPSFVGLWNDKELVDPKTVGEVVDGREYAAGYVWWQIDWEDDTTGWSVQRYLTETDDAETTPSTPGTGAFENGDVVRSTVALNTRSRPTLHGAVRDTVSSGAVGEVVDGREPADRYVWWQIEWDNGSTGWSVQRYLTEADTGSSGSRTSGFVWPVSGEITSNWYSDRSYGNHKAIDIAAWRGTEIGAVASGTVSLVDPTGNDLEGKYLAVQHDNGVQSRYMHVSEFAVSEGQRVSQGETIAYVGSTGHSTGPHLHFDFKQHGRRVRIPVSVGDYVQKGAGYDF
jgi:hypothetical protein